MKKIQIRGFVFILSLLISFFGISQAPQKMSYQAVIRNSSNQIIPKCNIGIRISILQGSASGAIVYSENQMAITDNNGLISLQIGSGNNSIGNISSINWSSGPYFIKTEADPSGGNDYSIVGSSELLSVPYALFALNTEKEVALGSSSDTIDLSKLMLGQEYTLSITKGLSFETNGFIKITDQNKNYWEGLFISYNKESGSLLLKVSEIVGVQKSNDWILKMSDKGNTGTKGDTGLTGLRGDIGLTGATGLAGTNGSKGEIGVTGATGPKGDTGDAGIDGISGEPIINVGLTSDYYRGDKTWQTLNASAIGLENVNNTSDIDKVVSTATQTALELKSNINSPSFTGTPTAVTAALGTNSTHIATTAFVLANTDQYMSTTAGNEIFTSSNTDVIAEGMTLTPISGKYLVLFNAQYNIEAGNNTGEAALELDATYTSMMSKTVTNATHGAAFGAGETLHAGVYSNVDAVTATGTLTLDGDNNPDSEFIFQFGAAFSTAANFHLVLINGASPCNIFWIAEGAIALGAGSQMQGTLLSNNGAVSMGSLSSITGSLYTRAGAIELDASSLSQLSNCNNNSGILTNFSVFTKIGSINNVGHSIISGDIATDFGAITGFETATLNGNVYLPGTGDATANFSIYQNGSQIPFSSRKRKSNSVENEVSLQAITSSLTSGESIDIRWNVNSGSVKFQNRILTIQSIK